MAAQPPTSAGQDPDLGTANGAIVALMNSGTPKDEAPGTFSDSPIPASSCNPNYIGCLSNTFDLDCGDLWGSSVIVVGVDEYRLDADLPGIACE